MAASLSMIEWVGPLVDSHPFPAKPGRGASIDPTRPEGSSSGVTCNWSVVRRYVRGVATTVRASRPSVCLSGGWLATGVPPFPFSPPPPQRGAQHRWRHRDPRGGCCGSSGIESQGRTHYPTMNNDVTLQSEVAYSCNEGTANQMKLKQTSFGPLIIGVTKTSEF